MKAPKTPRALPKSVSVIDMDRVLKAVKPDVSASWQQQRDYALLMLLYGCGLRISEALSMEAGHLPLGEWLHITGKGGKVRDIPILEAVREAVHQAAESCPCERPSIRQQKAVRFSPMATSHYFALPEMHQ